MVSWDLSAKRKEGTSVLELQVALQSICSQLEQSACAMTPSAPLHHTWQPQPHFLLPRSSRTGHSGSHSALGFFHTFKKTAFNICIPPPQYSSIWQHQFLSFLFSSPCIFSQSTFHFFFFFLLVFPCLASSLILCDITEQFVLLL